MRWHTEECMRYAVQTQRPFCIIECADQWRAFVAGLRDHFAAYEMVVDLLGIEEEVSNNDDGT